jgi:hypothetical protein
VNYLSLFSINLLRTVVRRDNSGFMIVLKSIRKLFNIVLVSELFESVGGGSWLAAVLAYVLCCVADEVVGVVEVIGEVKYLKKYMTI